MKNSIITFAFVLISLVVHAQEAKIIKGVNEAGDVASFELDCSKKFQPLAKGLRYTITRHEFKGPELKNTYRVLLVMEGFYTHILNKEMTISVVLSDGSVIEKRQTIEDDGYFNGACTLIINAINGPVNRYIKEIIVHADKDVPYVISEHFSTLFNKNLNNIISAK
jgi:hypothetical protein